jgi:hypothetical protein
MGTMSKSPTFWEADGALRAYANRISIVAVCLAVVVVALGIDVIITRVKPPTIIRISSDGQATVVGAGQNNPAVPAELQGVRAGQAPSEMEKEHFAVSFVNQYMGYDEHTLSENWAAAINVMTANLKQEVLEKMRQDNTVGELQDQHARSVVKITSAQPDPADPLTYHVYASRNVSHLNDRREQYQKLAEAYTIRLVEVIRSVNNPSGLLIAEFHTQQISADNTSAPQH